MNEILVLLHQITAINRAWKLARDRWGAQTATASLLRRRKSDLQARLIRENTGQVYLALDEENNDGEALYSVRFNESQTLPNGVVREDADHIPVRIAEELFTPKELMILLKSSK